jgi:Asp-tRNA(Asn)/Glu-tRNA(Gln) amidotransferase C subunit
MAETKYVSTFAMPSEYERAAMEARRRRRMAEMLAAQAYQPQEGGVAPIPTAAPLVQGLQAFLTARQLRKAEEAEQKAAETESEYAKRISGRLAGGYEYKPTSEDAETLKQREGEAPEAYRERMRTAQFTSPTFDEMLARTPEQTTLEPITPTARYKKSPEEALAMAETDVGMAAMKNRPMLAARLAQLLEKPETKTMEFGGQLLNIAGGQATPVTMGGKPVSEPTKPKTRTASEDFGGFIRTYYSDGSYKDERKTVAPSGPKDESLHLIDVNGVPTYVRRSEAVGKTAFVNKPAGGLTGDDKVDRRNHRNTRIQLQNAYDAISDFARELKQTPKEESLVGEKAGRLSTKYKLALGAVRVLQNTGVLNPGELPFIEDTLRNPQSFTQLFNPASRETIMGQVESIAESLERQSRINDEQYEYDVSPLKGRDWRREKIPQKAVEEGLTQADWDAATEQEKAAWR